VRESRRTTRSASASRIATPGPQAEHFVFAVVQARERQVGHIVGHLGAVEGQLTAPRRSPLVEVLVAQSAYADRVVQFGHRSSSRAAFGSSGLDGLERAVGIAQSDSNGIVAELSVSAPRLGNDVGDVRGQLAGGAGGVMV
jgi:hypothetical protein